MMDASIVLSLFLAQLVTKATSVCDRRTGPLSRMIGALSRWRKPDKQTAYDAALQRGAKLGIKKWVVPREQMELGVK